jgi:sugar phosphate isomerase/epimerase
MLQSGKAALIKSFKTNIQRVKRMNQYSRRKFIKASGCIAGATVLGNFFLPEELLGADSFNNKVSLSGHVWVYASKFPPDWDCSPILDQVFSDFKYAGLEGVELMESNLRHEDVVSRVGKLIQKYEIPVTGSSYYADMWDRSKQQEILEDVEVVMERLHKLGGSTFGITVGDAGHIKTEPELDAQADVLKKILKICDKNKIQANVHNHTFEVENNLHDLKGILERVPHIKLGPDLNWLIRGGVDPVWFINTYGHRIVYLHIRDQDAAGKWTQTVGEGVTDFPAIAEALKKAKFKGRAAVELAFENPPVNAVREDWKKSRKYVREVFGW